MIAHDMRTPLNALMMSLQAAKARLGASAQTDLDVAYRNAQALSAIVEALVDTSTTGQGRLALREHLPLDLVTSAVDQIAPMAEARRQRITTGELTALPALVVDGTRITRVLVNLLSNAVRFTPEGGHIRVAAEKDYKDGHECVVFSVRDDGPGVNIEDIERIFLEGVSIAKGGTSSTGLGLAVCKELVGRHEGRIWVEPDHSSGAVFSFSIPTDLRQPSLISA